MALVVVATLGSNASRVYAQARPSEDDSGQRALEWLAQLLIDGLYGLDAGCVLECAAAFLPQDVPGFRQCVRVNCRTDRSIWSSPDLGPADRARSERLRAWADAIDALRTVPPGADDALRLERIRPVLELLPAMTRAGASDDAAEAGLSALFAATAANTLLNALSEIGEIDTNLLDRVIELGRESSRDGRLASKTSAVLFVLSLEILQKFSPAHRSQLIDHLNIDDNPQVVADLYMFVLVPGGLQ